MGSLSTVSLASPMNISSLNSISKELHHVMVEVIACQELARTQPIVPVDPIYERLLTIDQQIQSIAIPSIQRKYRMLMRSCEFLKMRNILSLQNSSLSTTSSKTTAPHALHRSFTLPSFLLRPIVFESTLAKLLEIDDLARFANSSRATSRAVAFFFAHNPFLENAFDPAKPFTIKGPGSLPYLRPYLRSHLLEYRSSLDNKAVALFRRYATYQGFTVQYDTDEKFKSCYLYRLCQHLTRMSFPDADHSAPLPIRKAFMAVVCRKQQMKQEFQSVTQLDFTAPLQRFYQLNSKAWQASLAMHTKTACMFPKLEEMKVFCPLALPPFGSLWSQRICEEWLPRLITLTIRGWKRGIFDEAPATYGLPESENVAYPLRTLVFQNCMLNINNHLLRKYPNLESLEVSNEEGMGLEQYNFNDTILIQLRESCPQLKKLYIGRIDIKVRSVVNFHNFSNQKFLKAIMGRGVFPTKFLPKLFRNLSLVEFEKFKERFGNQLDFQLRFRNAIPNLRDGTVAFEDCWRRVEGFPPKRKKERQRNVDAP